MAECHRDFEQRQRLGEQSPTTSEEGLHSNISDIDLGDRNKNNNDNHSKLLLQLSKLKYEINQQLYQSIDEYIQSLRKPFTDLQHYLDARKYNLVTDVGICENILQLNKSMDKVKKEKFNSSSITTTREKDQKDHDRMHNISVILLELRKMLRFVFVNKAVEVAQSYLNDTTKLRISISGNDDFTEDNIKKQYHLFLQLHPDHFYDYRGEVFTKFLQALQSEKEEALKRLRKKAGSAERQELINENEYMEKAMHYWKIYMDWQNISKCQFEKVKHLQAFEYQGTTRQQQIQRKIYFAGCCCMHYRQACKIIDTKANENRQVSNFDYRYQQFKIRKFISIAYCASQMPFESQLYAIGAFHILLQYPGATTDDIEQIGNILHKVKSRNKGNGQQQAQSPSHGTKDNHNVRNPIDSRIVAVYSNDTRMINHVERKQMQNDVREGIAKLAKELATPQAALVSYFSPSQALISTSKNYKAGGIVAIVLGSFGTVGSAGLAVTAAIETIFGISLLGPLFIPLGIGLSVALLIAGTVSTGLGIKAFKYGIQSYRESQIREKLNVIIQQAIQAYNNKEHEHFLQQLSNINSAIVKDKVPLIDYEKNTRFVIKSNELIDELLHHGYRPDGIAYLLVIIADTLIYGNVTLQENPESSQHEMASNLLTVVYESEKLQDKARELDNIICNQSWKIELAKLFNSSDIPESWVNDATTAPFFYRLQEITLVARLNYILVQIMIGRPDNFKLAVSKIRKVIAIVENHFQFFSSSEDRIEALKNLLTAIGCDPSINANHATIAIAPTPTVRSFEINLQQNVDIWHVFNVLSNGRFTISATDFLNTLKKEQHSVEAKALIKELGEKLPDKNILKYRYLSIISKLTKLQFELYEITSEGQQYTEKPMDDQLSLLEQPLAIICLGMKNDYYNHGIPESIFIQDHNPTLAQLYDRRRAAENISKQLTAKINLEIADQHMMQAKGTIVSVRKLAIYDQARQLYDESFQLFPTLQACWGIAECDLVCGKNKATNQFLQGQSKKCTDLKLSSQSLFYYQARALRGLQQYDKAAISINKALDIEANNQKLSEERDKILLLHNKLSDNTCHGYSETVIDFDENIYNQRHCSSSDNNYNILSIDGEGIRAIIPAVVLHELERDTHKPISHSFNLLAGTSSGGITTLGLAIPDMVGSYKPKYHASDILDIYTQKSSDIFRRNYFKSYWYTSQPLQKLLKQSFEDTKLSQLLTDVAIPACNLTKAYITTYFTRCSALDGVRKDFNVVDVALATSAAPTYFPPHKIVMDYHSGNAANETKPIINTFVDGGIQVNNPASYAYKHAIDQKYSRENIYLLSLGTGDCFQNSVNPAADQSLLFWAAKIPQLLKAQQNNVDDELNTFMGSRYHRWQYWLEDPIALDDTKSKNIKYLTNAGYALVEDLKADDNNSWNKLVEHLMQ